MSADDGRTVSYGELRDLAGRIATVLYDRGITRNDRVALLANNSIDAIRLRLAGAQRPHFAPQLRCLQRFVDEQRDLVHIEGFVRVVIRALFHRLDGGVDARIRRQENDERVWIAILDFLEN